MTNNEIIKALECCSNAKPCDETDLAEIALDLINRLQTENEKLKNENDSMREDITQSVKELKNLRVLYAKDISKSKAEAMTAFAERLQIRCIKQDGCLWSSDIGAELKEMLGEE